MVSLDDLWQPAEIMSLADPHLDISILRPTFSVTVYENWKLCHGISSLGSFNLAMNHYRVVAERRCASSLFDKLSFISILFPLREIEWFEDEQLVGI